MAGFPDFVEAIMTPSPAVFLIGIVIVVLLPVLLHFVLVRSTPYTSLPTVLLVGPSGAGKTSLLTLLERGDAPTPTHHSQVSHSAEFTASRDGKASFRDQADASGTHTKFLLVDTPGHGKLRTHALGRLQGNPDDSKVKAVVFVVDASALAGDGEALTAAAAFLHDALLALQRRASAKANKSAVPVLVASNKQDLFTAVPAAMVRVALEGEIGRIRASRSKGLLDSGVSTDQIGTEEHDDWLGEYGSQMFAFEQMQEFNIDVDVLDGTVTGGDGAPSVDNWWSWIIDKI